jgi:serine/threonine protein kinase
MKASLDPLAPTALTVEGSVMGTIGYMSPEQAMGGEVDFRSDQFSFGVVLYEMVTGAPAFQRKTYAETTAAILRDQPERLGGKMAQVPAPFVWIVERCLAKDATQRYASSHDLARARTFLGSSTE